MKFTCQKNEMVQTIQIISKATPNNPQNPILSGFYLETQDNKIELRATDNEIGIITDIPAEIEDPGNVILSGKTLQEIIRSLPGENLTLTFDEEKKIANIRSGSTSFDLISMNGQFSSVRMTDPLINFKMKDTLLKSLIKKTVFACSTDEKRPIFTGCLLEIKDEEITMAATNTHRLSVKNAVLPEFKGSRRMIIPSKILNELLRTLNSDIPEDIDIACSDTRISFSFGNIYMISRLIEGQFPDCNRVIPADFKTRVTLKTADFMGAVERISLIARHDDYKVMRFEFSSGQVRISSNNQNIGYAEETVPAVIDGEDVNISFNFTYLLDVLKNIDTEEIYFSLNEKLSPAAVREPGNESFIYIITPVRTSH